MESLLDRCLKRTSNRHGQPYTKHDLAKRCTLDIAFEGPQSRTCIDVKGVRGRGLKKQRRLMPSGPLGAVIGAYKGTLSIEFPSVQLLSAVNGDTAVFYALADYYTGACEAPIPEQIGLEMASQFAHTHLAIEVDPDVIEALLQRWPPCPFGNSRELIVRLLEVEHQAVKNRWKRVDLHKWQSAGLTWPLHTIPRSRPTPEFVTLRVPVRHAKLLHLFNQADDSGKLFLEQAAKFAAVQSAPAAG